MRLSWATLLVAPLWGGCFLWITDKQADERWDLDGDGIERPEDCDDDDPAVGTRTWHLDDDGDGHGSPTDTLDACEQPPGYVANGDDCDDEDATASPGADELCDGIDNDCDGTVDEDQPSSTWYYDGDGDGAGDDGVTIDACEAPPDHVDIGGDCDDTDPARSPLEAEVCDGVDNDCDDAIDLADDDVIGAQWYTDADGDGYGDPATELVDCVQPPDTVGLGGDCDDVDPAISPDADETCDGLVDEDCDGLVDEADAVDAAQWYPDLDGDGFGDDLYPTLACERPADHVASALDCDDTDPYVNPLVLEVCDGIDNNCNTAIDDADPTLSSPPLWYDDDDGDGFGEPTAVTAACTAPAGTVATAGDCDDGQIAVNPSAAEVCDGLDNDCDGRVDDADPGLDTSTGTTFYLDTDGDSFGDTAVASPPRCEAPEGWVAADGDCDDIDPFVFPGAPELCDGVDNDCNGLAEDDGIADWYADADGDTFGTGPVVTQSCTAPPGAALRSGDCDDGRAAVNPDAAEVCDGLDNDCDALTDEADPDIDADSWYTDDDGDGHGVPGVVVVACTQPPDTAATDDDCDDTDPAINPDAAEVCGGVDEDCDGLVDDLDPNLIGAPRWSLDADSDGFGRDTQTTLACTSPPAHVSTGGDCDDGNPAVSPAASEVCNGIDDDCDTQIDGADGDVDLSTGTVFFLDEDADGYGDVAGAPACDLPAGFAVDGGDCDDEDPTTYPGASELCDGLDNDCDTMIDEGGPTVWYADADGDGFGDPTVSQADCTQPPGFVLSPTDCDDGDDSISPAALEVCNATDDDCDGLVDDADPGVSAPTWYDDGDSDGFGDPTTAVDACTAPPGHVADASDCDDQRALANPAATERCNGFDDDCNGLVDVVDPGVIDAELYYPDADLDGFGDPASSTLSCSAPPGTVLDGTDCDDGDFQVNPGEAEVCDGGVDNDCDGLADDADPGVSGTTPWYADTDGDSQGDPLVSVDACLPPPGTVAADTDCDDADPGTYLGAPELCDGVDNDCNGLVDDGVLNSDWWPDTDGDGFGAGTPVSDCARPPGYVANNTDCDDGDAAVRPTAAEVCNGTDDDCDGRVDDSDPDLSGAPTWYADSDSDGYGDPTSPLDACLQPAAHVADGTDCDDGTAAVNPGATEVPGNVVDEDCDGVRACYTDADADGFGTSVVVADDGDGVCLASDGESTNAGDCDDTDPTVQPLGVEVCDGVDNDCNSIVDDGVCDTGDTGQPDDDGDGIPNALDPCPDNPVPEPNDNDGDGVGDLCDNCPFVSNSTQADSDGDGYGDACDGALPGDKDGDGLGNGTENQEGTDKDIPDTDGDGLTDGQEVLLYGTDPLDPDTDGGGTLDGAEVVGGCDPLNGGDDGGC